MRATRCLLIGLILVLTVCTGAAEGTRWLLVDFGKDAGTTTFGTYNSTWNQVLRHVTYTEYVDPDGNPDHWGIADKVGTAPGNNVTFYGVQGTTAINMQIPHRIVATFYNKSGSNKTFYSRVTFKDADSPAGAVWEAPWYEMYGDKVVGPGQTVEQYFNIADALHVDAPLAPPSNGDNFLVNISLTVFNPDIVLTKIELSDEQDTTAPTTPGNLQATATATSAEAGNCVVELTWDASTDTGEGVHRYHVYRDDGTGWVLHEMVDPAWTAYWGTGTVVYHDFQAEPNTQYTYGVEAFDAEINGMFISSTSDPNSRRGNVSVRATTTITTPSFSMPTLIDATTDITYLGKFRVPSTGNWDNIGQGLAFNPDGNPSYDPNTELPGSLYITGRHDEYTIGEFSIAKPILTEDIPSMNQSTMLQNFVALFSWTPSGGNAIWYFCGYHPGGNGVGPHVYGSQYRFYAGPLDEAHLCAFDMDLTTCLGPWHIGDSVAPDKVNFMYSGKFIFPVPQAWADTYTGGRSMFVGNGGHVSGHGMPTAGPSLYAIAPWESGSLPATNGVISDVELLRYGTHDDSWDTWHDNWSYLTRTNDACWAVSGGKQAVIVSGVIARGDTWYGGGDGAESTTSSYDLPPTIVSSKGYNATYQEGSLFLFNPADLARVAQGTMDPDEPRAYQTLDVQKNFLLNKNAAGVGNLSIAFDQTNGYLYVHEADGETAGRSLMHVYQIVAGGGGDTTAPAAVSDLAASNPTSSSVDLDWTAPGDDGSSGTATVYDIRYSTSTISEANWAGATQVTGEPTPSAAGSAEGMTVGGLSSDTTYFFAIKTADEVPNISAISNSPSGATTAGGGGGDAIAQWELDENGGTTAGDSAGTSDGTLSGGVSWTTGHDGSGLDFDGVDGQVDGSFNGTLDLDGAMSMTCWVWSDITPGTGDSPFGIGVSSLASNIYFYANGSVRRYADAVVVNPSVYPTAGVWYHLAYTSDGTTHRIYLDGVDRGSSTNATDTGMVDVFRMGNRVKYGGRAFDGKIDGVRVYDRELSAAEVDTIYQGGPTNAAPSVDAGSDDSITLPTDTVNLDGTVSDDGLPDPPGAFTTLWTKDSGPGTVTFGDDAAVDTTATFSQAGVYVLKLEADDSELTGSDTVTITVNAEPQPTVAFNTTSSSGDESATPASLSVSLSASYSQTVTVDYAVTGGDATGGGVDYTLAAGTLTFDPNDTSETVDIAVVDDGLDELDETVEVTLSNPSNATLGTNTVHTYTINDNDEPPTVQFDLTASSGDESVTPVDLAVSLSAESGRTVTVDYAVTGGTATSPDDFTIAGAQLTFDPGVTGQNVSLIIVDDGDDEPDETVEVTLSAPANATLGANTAHTYTILDNDLPPNQAPTVDAGSDQTITLPTDTVNLDGTVNDDGLPNPPGAVTTLWTKDSGPGTVTFGDDSAIDTTATFSQDGVYVLKLEADDSDLTASDTVTITVEPATGGPTDMIAYWDLNDGSGDTATDVTGHGNDGTVTGATWTTGYYGGALAFDGVDDQVDGSIAGGTISLIGAMSLSAWVYAPDGPDWSDAVVGLSDGSTGQFASVLNTGNVRMYGDAVLVNCTVTPPTGQWYHLCYTTDGTTHRIYLDSVDRGTNTATNGAGTANTFRIGNRVQYGGRPLLGKIDDVRVYDRQLSPGEVDALYNGTPVTNAAPVVDAGSDDSITLPTDTVNLDGTVSDDGLPDPPGAFTTLWTKDSGPGTVTFGDDTAIDTTATFSQAGVYVLKLEADDSELTGSDTVTITVNAEPQPSVAFDLTSSSGDESVTTVDLSVSLSDAYDSGTVTVDYAVTGGDATDPDDYTIAGTQLTFAAGVTQQDITLTIVNDGLVEPDETVEVTLSAPSNATLGSPAVHTYTINDNDVYPTVAFDLTSSSANESVATANLSVSLSASYPATVTVDYAVTGGDAVDPDDYSIAGTQLTFTSGITQQDIVITVVDEFDFESDETIEVTLSSPFNATLGSPTVHTYTILNDDAANVAPTVDVGTDDSITLPTDTVNLDGTVSDDGLPDPPATVTTTWTKFGGPGTVTFGDANAVDTTAQFSVDGVYVLQLEADDSDLTANDTVTITVLPAPDTTPPAAITDLAASNPTENTVDLDWTAPGDDGSTGTASSYDVRYSTATITEGNWASATQATGEPTPSAAGTPESMTVSGLSDDTTYYFAIKTSDEVPNTSAISNVPSATTQASTPTVWNVSTILELENAVDNYASGDEIVMATGTYIIDAYLTLATDDVLLRGATGNRDDVILVGSGMNTDVHPKNGLIIDAHDVTVRDLTIKECFWNGIQIKGENDTDRTTLQNLKILDIGERYIKNSTNSGSTTLITEDVLIEDIHMEQTQALTSPHPDLDYIGGIDGMGIDNWIVRDCTAVNIQGASGGGRGGVFLWNGATDCTVERNLMLNCDRGVCIGNSAVPSHAYAGNNHCDGGIVRNNFIVRGAGIGLEMAYTANLKVYHNTVYSDDSSYFKTVQIYDNAGQTVNLDVSYNIIRGQIDENSTGSYTLTDNPTGSQCWPSWFVDPLNGDLHLTATAAPVLDAALPLAEVTDDYDGDARSATPDIGADESPLSPPTPTVQFDAASSNGDESVTPASLSVSLSASYSQTVTVDYAVTGGDATGGGVDYALAAGTLTFDPYDTSETIDIAIVDDGLVESDETIEVTLSNPSNAALGANTVHTYTILDSDVYPTVEFDLVSSSDDESVTSASLSVSLSGAYVETVTVDYAVTGGDATGGGVDYTLAAGTLTFDPNDVAKTVDINIVDDGEDESDETIEVTLSNPSNASLGTNTVHTYTILDNDGVSPPGQASSPSPASGATKVSRSVIVSWMAGAGADSHDVYFGTDPNPGASEFQGNQAGTTFDPGYLGKNVWYYWRIDEVNAGGTTTGVVWSFKTGSK